MPSYPFLPYGTLPLLACRRLIAVLGATGLSVPKRITFIERYDRDEDNENRVLRILPFPNIRIETGPVTLSEHYLRMIEAVEAAPENQSGADKTWIETALSRRRKLGRIVRFRRRSK